MKQPKQYPPLPAMATDETLIGLYARTAPDVPDWFLQQEIKLDETKIYDRNHIFLNEEIYFKWKMYFAIQMIKLLNKK